jgi:hypothetical protein
MKRSVYLALRFLLSCLGGLIVVVVGCIMIYPFLFSQDWAQGFAFILIVGLIPIVNSPLLIIALLVLFFFQRTICRHLRWWYLGFPSAATAVVALGKPFLWQEVVLTGLWSIASTILFYYANTKNLFPSNSSCNETS